MRFTLTYLLLLSNLFLWGQSDFSDRWEDFYSYNNVKDFVHTDTQIIALSDNAVFFYDKFSGEMEKISSVNGLSGETTSAFYFEESLNRIVIGYENGLVEIIDENRRIVIKPDILNFNILGSKRINHIAQNGTDVYFSTPFGIVVFDIESLEFKDTYFIGAASSEVYINETLVFNDKLYAVTENGIYIASIDEPYLIDFNNWSQISSVNYSNIEVFGGQLYVSRNKNLYRFENDSLFTFIHSQPQDIRDIKGHDNRVTITTQRYVSIYNETLNLVYSTTASSNEAYNFSANTAITIQNDLYIATAEFGILNSDVLNIHQYIEIHPDGPTSNQVFSISNNKNHLWVVYGGYSAAYGPLGTKKGVGHYNGENWVNIPYANDAIIENDLVDVSIDPNHENRVFISSWRHGMLIIENDEVTTHWNEQNSGLEQMDGYIYTLVSSSTFDENGNLWVANGWQANRLKKYSASGTWTSYNLGSIMTSTSFGLNKIIIDKSGNKWIGSRRNGALVISENGSSMISLTTNSSKGDIPDLNVRALAVDKNNKVWIGTRAGLVVFNSSANIFNTEVYTANPVVIAFGQDDGFGEALLGNQNINTICVDGADNKWFGTDSGGILFTNPSGQETLLQFDKTNSPLPSNRIMKIQFDEQTGKVFFATDKGIVAYNSNVAPFGKHLEEVYAYPNPVKKHHEFVTIDGRNGTHLPNGTNVKILDAAGKLVYETNVKEGQELYGGKVVWNKTNLAGNKVASGVYIVLLTIPDISETAMTKIAIIN